MRRYESPRAALLWVVWLIGQLTVSVLLLILSGFHFGLTRPDLCDTANTTIYSNDSITHSIDCGLKGCILALEMLAIILSAIDATANLHYLLHRVLDKQAGIIIVAQQALESARLALVAAKQALEAAEETLITGKNVVEAVKSDIKSVLNVDNSIVEFKVESMNQALKCVEKKDIKADGVTKDVREKSTARKAFDNAQTAFDTAQKSLKIALSQKRDEKLGDIDESFHQACVDIKCALKKAVEAAQQAGVVALSVSAVAMQIIQDSQQVANAIATASAANNSDNGVVQQAANNAVHQALRDCEAARVKAQQLGKEAQNPEENADCKNGLSVCTSCTENCTCNTPVSTIRILICWILVHCIFITIAASTHEWSWQTDRLEVLVNTAVFFLACIVYVLLIVGVLVWHGIFYNCKWSKGDKYLLFAPMLTIGLIISSVLVTLAALVVFFTDDGSGIGSYDHIVVLVIVFIFVIVTSFIWFILLSCSRISVVLYENPCLSTVLFIIFGILLTSCFIIFIVVYLLVMSVYLLFIFIIPIIMVCILLVCILFVWIICIQYYSIALD